MLPLDSPEEAIAFATSQRDVQSYFALCARDSLEVGAFAKRGSDPDHWVVVFFARDAQDMDKAIRLTPDGKRLPSRGEQG